MKAFLILSFLLIAGCESSENSYSTEVSIACENTRKDEQGIKDITYGSRLKIKIVKGYCRVVTLNQ